MPSNTPGRRGRKRRGSRVPLPILPEPEDDKEEELHYNEEIDHDSQPRKKLSKARRGRQPVYSGVETKGADSINVLPPQRQSQRRRLKKRQSFGRDDDDELAAQLVSLANTGRHSSDEEEEEGHEEEVLEDLMEERRNSHRHRHRQSRQVKFSKRDPRFPMDADLEKNKSEGLQEETEPECEISSEKEQENQDQEESDNREEEKREKQARFFENGPQIIPPRVVSGQENAANTPIPDNYGTFRESAMVAEAGAAFRGAICDARGLVGGSGIMGGVLAVAELVLLGTEEGTAVNAERSLRVATTLVSTMGAEISKLERERTRALAAAADAEARAAAAYAARAAPPPPPGQFQYQEPNNNNNRNGAFQAAPSHSEWQQYNNNYRQQYNNPSAGITPNNQNNSSFPNNSFPNNNNNKNTSNMPAMVYQGTPAPAPNTTQQLGMGPPYQYITPSYASGLAHLHGAAPQSGAIVTTGNTTGNNGNIKSGNRDRPISPSPLPPNLLGMSQGDLANALERLLNKDS